jgi:hypothetical protein
MRCTGLRTLFEVGGVKNGSSSSDCEYSEGEYSTARGLKIGGEGIREGERIGVKSVFDHRLGSGSAERGLVWLLRSGDAGVGGDLNVSVAILGRGYDFRRGRSLD